MIDVSLYGLEPYTPISPCVGERFGRLVALATGRRPDSKKAYAVCLCDCGNRTVSRIDGLRSGTTASCGCGHRDAVTKHGLWHHRLYNCWRNMMCRCYDPKNKRWAKYGGRGITVCAAWHDIANFIADMEPSYKQGLELDRIDVDGSYSPKNCRWATHDEQARNKRNLIYITIGSETKTAAEWARERGLCYGTVWERIKVLGWGPVEAVSTPALDVGARCAVARKARR